MNINPCPRCFSENISIRGLAWVEVACLDCNFIGQAHSYGSRLVRYEAAIASWNEGEEDSDGDEIN